MTYKYGTINNWDGSSQVLAGMDLELFILLTYYFNQILLTTFTPFVSDISKRRQHIKWWKME